VLTLLLLQDWSNVNKFSSLMKGEDDDNDENDDDDDEVTETEEITEEADK